jgi:hypothetical protein
MRLQISLKEAFMGELIRFPSRGEQYVRQQVKDRGLAYHHPRTHSGRILEAKILGLPDAGRRQKPRFMKRSR